MTSYEGKYEKFKISLSLGTDKLYISALDEVTYDLYDLDVTKIIFNNDHIKLSQLFHIIKKGIEKKDENIHLSLEQANKLVKLNYKIENDYFSLNQTFELVKQLTEATSTKELKKELFELKKDYSKLKELVNELVDNVLEIDNKYTKKDSIIPVIKIKIDEDEVEKKYKWFLDFLKTLITENPLLSYVYKEINIPDNTIDGKTPLKNLEWDHLTFGHNWNQNKIVQQYCPDKNLYIYLRKRNINIWKDQNNNMYFAYME
jgi:hypothetical protein